MQFQDQTQQIRWQTLIDTYLEDVRDRVTPEGEIIGFFDDSPDVALRERIWVAYSLLWDTRAESIQKANQIIERSNMITEAGEYTCCHFVPMMAVQMLLKQKDRLSERAQDMLLRYLRASLPEMIGNPEFEFVGVNDNFPCMASFAAIVGGKIIGNGELADWGAGNLRSLCAMLERRGLQSEHTSPTYTAIQILAIAEIVNYTDDAELKALALYAERRLAFGALAFYHPGFGKMCGPYSRAYTVDSTASVHMMDFWLYAVLGVRTLSALDEMFDGQKQNRVMHGSRWFETVQFIWLAACQYHVTEVMLAEALNRTFPYEVRATCEYSSSRSDLRGGAEDAVYPAGENEISCYMTEEYAVGVSKVPFHSGEQTESLYILCKNREKVEHSKDLQAIYLRYIVNDDIPQTNQLLPDWGRKIGLMHENIGFIGYRPVKKVVGKQIKSMKLSIIIPQLYGDTVQIERSGRDIYLRVHHTYIAFFALNNGGDIREEKADGFTMISLYNYAGPEKELTLEDYFDTVNGVLFAVGNASEGSFSDFMRREKQCSDQVIRMSHSRQSRLRRICFEYAGSCLELKYDVECCGVQYGLINGALAGNTYYYDSEHGVCGAKELRRMLQ